MISKCALVKDAKFKVENSSRMKKIHVVVVHIGNQNEVIVRRLKNIAMAKLKVRQFFLFVAVFLSNFRSENVCMVCEWCANLGEISDFLRLKNPFF